MKSWNKRPEHDSNEIKFSKSAMESGEELALGKL